MKDNREIILIRNSLGIIVAGLVLAKYLLEYHIYSDNESLVSEIARSVSFLFVPILIVGLAFTMLYFSYVIIKKSENHEEISQRSGTLRKPFALALVIILTLPIIFIILMILLKYNFL